MTVRRVCRLAAVALAVAGAIDPAITRTGTERDPVTIATPSAEDLPAAHTIKRLIGSDVDTSVSVLSAVARAAACPSAGACVVVSDGRVPERLTAGAAVLGAWRTASAARRIMRVDAPRRASLHAVSALDVTLADEAAIEVLDAGIPLGIAATGEAGEARTVPWTPVDDGPRALQVEVGKERVDVGVVVDAAPLPVLIVEPEPSWLGTFVRRAVEDDPRFAVVGRTQVAPPVAVTRGGGVSLADDSLQAHAAVLLTAPDLLRAAEIDRLERFVADRGGALLIVLDRRPSGPVLRLLPSIAGEHRRAAPQSIGPLRGTEVLTFRDGPGVSALARAEEGIVIAARAVGRGQVIVAGAFDAWRYRAADAVFASYFATLLWEAASASGQPLDVRADRTLVRTGAEVAIAVEAQTIAPWPAETTAEGAFDCGDVRGPLRLWPGPRPGTFAATFRPQSAATCRVTVAVAGLAGATWVRVEDDVRDPPADGRALEGAMAAHGASVFDEAQAHALAVHVRARLATHAVPQTWHPMRSPLWLVPLLACLGGEWWLRRRAGLR